MNEVSAEFPKKILQSNKPEGEKIRIVELEAPGDEAAWVADELQRLHAAGRRWKDFAVLYRQHAHRNQLVEELSLRKIPFVISQALDTGASAGARRARVSSPDRSPLRRHRVRSRPRRAGVASHAARPGAPGRTRRTKAHHALYDVLQSPQTNLPFDPSHAAIAKLLEFLAEQRKTSRRRTAREILGDLVEWLEVHPRASRQDRKYVNQLAQFMKEWEPKSETRGLAEFLEYLDYFQQAGGTLSLEDDAPGDAVQLMTVHGAKGLEFPHVFLLRVNFNAFPARNVRRCSNFPTA